MAQNWPVERDSSTLTPRGRKWVASTTRPLDALALVFLFVMVMTWAFPDAPRGVQATFTLVMWLVWAGFAFDYVARLAMSRPRVGFVRTHKLDLVMVLLPMLRMLRVFLLLRKSLATVSTDRIAGSIVRIVVVFVVVAAFLEWRVEFDAPGATITSFRTALWWAVVTTTTVGYGDYAPVTPVGRLIAMCVMIVGIGLIGTVSATVAAWFVNRPKVANPDDPAQGAVAGQPQPAGDDGVRERDQLLARLDELASQQDEIRTMLVRLQEQAAPQ